MDARAVLVLGAGGFIGRHLVARLAGAGIEVLAATRHACDFEHPRVRNVVALWSEPGDFAALLPGCAAVVHAASTSTPGSSMATPQIDGNLRTTLALVQALQDAPGKRLLYLSSAGTLYGERDTPAVETDTLRPRSYHGAGKAAAEHFLQAWSAQYAGTAVVLRPTNVYGAGQTARRGFAIVPTAMACAASGAPLQIWGDGSQVRDYLHVDDLVSLCLQVLATALAPGCHIHNAASGQASTLNDLLAVIERISGRPIARSHGPARAADINTILVNADSAQQRFDWAPTVTLESGLARTWAWQQAQV